MIMSAVGNHSPLNQFKKKTRTAVVATCTYLNVMIWSCNTPVDI